MFRINRIDRKVSRAGFKLGTFLFDHWQLKFAKFQVEIGSFHVIVSVQRSRTAKKCTKNHHACGQPLSCKLHPLFCDVPVTVAVVVLSRMFGEKFPFDRIFKKFYSSQITSYLCQK